MTLTEFLLARIAEDEVIARGSVLPGDYASERAKTPADWKRIFDDEAMDAAQPHSAHCGWRIGEFPGDKCTCGYPARVLAECEAKRRIVERETAWNYMDTAPYREAHTITWSADGESVTLKGGLVLEGPDATRFISKGMIPVSDTPVLRLLALPYAEHPDYEEAWRPGGPSGRVAGDRAL